MDKDTERLLFGIIAALSIFMKWRKRRAKSLRKLAKQQNHPSYVQKGNTRNGTRPLATPARRMDPIDIAIARERSR